MTGPAVPEGSANVQEPMPVVALRLEPLAGSDDGEAYVASETLAMASGIVVTIYVANGRGLSRALGAEAHRLVALLETLPEATGQFSARSRTTSGSSSTSTSLPSTLVARSV